MASPQIPLGLEMVDTQAAWKDRLVCNAGSATTSMSSSDHAPGAEKPMTTLEGVRGFQDTTEYRGSWLIMQGSVGSKERCPVPGCGVTFGPVLITPYGWFPGGEKRRGRKNKNSIANDLGCIEHKTRPRRYFANCRPFVDSQGRSVGRPETDLHGNPFYFYEAAERLVQAVRKAYQDDPEHFDATMWSNTAQAEMTVEKFVEDYFAHIKEDSPTHHPDNVAAIFRHKILPHLGKMCITRITKKILKEWIVELKKKGRDEKGNRIPGLPKGQGANHPNYVKKILDTLHAYFNWLKDEEHINKIPEFPSINSVKIVAGSWVVPEGQRIIVGCMEKYSKNAEILLEVACDLAMRTTHLYASVASDIRPDGIFIGRSYTNNRVITKTKNDIFDVFPLSPDTMERLRTHANGKNPDDYLFINEKSNLPFTTPEFSYLYKKAARDAKISSNMYRTVRKSTISMERTRQAKKAERAIQEKGGWKNPETGKMIYVLPTDNRIGGSTNDAELAPDYQI